MNRRSFVTLVGGAAAAWPVAAQPWLVKELSELYPPEAAHLWLYSPHKRLAGQRPADLIQAGKTEEVLRFIAQLKDSAFV